MGVQSFASVRASCDAKTLSYFLQIASVRRKSVIASPIARQSQRQFASSNQSGPSFQVQRDSHEATTSHRAQRFTTTQHPLFTPGRDSVDICTAAPSLDPLQSALAPRFHSL